MKTLITLLFTFLLSIPLSLGQMDTLAVKSIEGITDKMLELISGEVGQERDWDTYRNLFTATAQKVSMRKSKTGRTIVRAQNIEEFIRNVGPLYSRDGFEEYTIGLTINEFNGIANVFQSFYCRNLLGTYENRGVNSYQLVYANGRWWITSVIFTNETEDMPLPDHLLSEKYQSKN